MKRFLGLATGVLMGLMLFASTVHASYAERVALETLYTDKAQHLLDSMFGEHLFSVATTVKMGTSSWRVRYTGKANVKTSGKRKSKKSDTSYQILPGYDALKNLAPDGSADVPFNSQITKLTPKVSNIVLDIVVSSEVSKREAKNTRKLLAQVLGLNAKRGDKIKYTFQRFPITKSLDKARALANQDKQTVKTPTAKLLVYALILFVVYICIYLYVQMKILKSASKDIGKGMASAAAAMPMFQKPRSEPSAPVSSEDDMKHYFGFVTDSNIEGLISIIQTEQMGAQHIGVIVSYLNPELGVKVVESVDDAAKAGIMKVLADQRVLGKDSLSKLEELVKGKLECMVGGANIINDLFGLLKSSEKKSIFETLKSDPATFEKIRPTVSLYDDIQYLADDDIKTVIGEVNLDMLSASLIRSDTATRTKVESNLSKAANAMVKQFRDLKAESITKGEIDLAKAYVLNIMIQLDNSGQIVLKDKVSKLKKPAPKATPEPAPADKKEAS
ncbi:hypothetical protein HOH87_06140 [bacterium]|jgi:hypothetical protein|nr:hypothetical protein [bacterium]